MITTPQTKWWGDRNSWTDSTNSSLIHNDNLKNVQDNSNMQNANRNLNRQMLENALNQSFANEDLKNSSTNSTNSSSSSTSYSSSGSQTVDYFDLNKSNTVISTAISNGKPIHNHGSNVTIFGGDGGDTVESYKGNNVVIFGNASKDSLYICKDSSESSILGGDGDDRIGLYTRANLAFGGDGHNLIKSGDAYNTLIGGNDIDEITIHSDDDFNMAFGGDNIDYIESYGSNNTLIAGNGNDTLKLLYDETGNIVFAGDGDDSINASNSKDTLIGGKGNDTIELGISKYNVIIYNAGDGDDYIKGETYNHMVLYLNGSRTTYSTIKSGDDLVVNYTGGKITLSGYREDNLSSMIKLNDDSVPSLVSAVNALEHNLETLTSALYEFDRSQGSSYVGNTISVNNNTNQSGNTISVSDNTSKSGNTTSVNNNTEDDTDVFTLDGSAVINKYTAIQSTLEDINKNTVSRQITLNNNTESKSDNVTLQGVNEGDTVINNYYYGPVTINNVNNVYTYSGGAKVIENYQQGEVVRLDSDYQGIDLNGNSFFVKSSSGQVEIQNSRDKFIGYSAGNSDVIAYSYLASGGGNIDGRDKSQAEILIGADHHNNQIFAGNGGSSLWGANGGADTLVGGDGYDEFVFAQGSGGDVIQNAGSNDIVNLLGITLDQISNVYVSKEQVHIDFTNGEFLQVKGNTGVGYRLENKTYVCNQSTGEWSTK